jgi:hypothetical protein
MGNSYRTLTVLLSNDVDKDFIDSVVKAIGMVRGVEDVVLGTPNDVDTFAARRIAYGTIRQRLFKALLMDTNDAVFKYDLVERDDPR